MPNKKDNLNRVFGALADPTRRAVLASLGRGPASVSELASPFDMALPSFTQHLKVLEQSGLVKSRKRGRSRIVCLVPARLKQAESWLERRRGEWETRLDRMDEYVLELKEASDDA